MRVGTIEVVFIIGFLYNVEEYVNSRYLLSQHINVILYTNHYYNCFLCAYVIDIYFLNS